ncbi:sulfurtransferase TusA family protein [Oceanibacterium hippocampi]|uniref:Sulfurtransferase TusA n=1 Tax=Oceanibacterium hippocampi TaxID=745714 RepID=A0A1Y5TUL8_9PROT|nr:sulfurtransferase TusA family protein [Oceanibacterium hippocampi]SLN72993.1 Sulfurtransferase TusA [Oceanibacterium hippocampi]
MPETNRLAAEGAVLDTSGLACPLPVLKARKALRDVAPGNILTIIATDPASVIDFRHFCDVSGNELVSQTESAGIFTYVIRRGEATAGKR